MTGLPRHAFAACAHSLKRPAAPGQICAARVTRGPLVGLKVVRPTPPPREKHMLFRHARARMLAAAVLTTTGLATVAAAAIAAPASAASTTARGEFPGPA